VQHFGLADGTPLTRGSATPGAGAAVTFRAMDAAVSSSPKASSASSAPAPAPAWQVTSTADSPDTTPSTSFTQGDKADTYTLTVTNDGTAPTDGTTPVTVTDILDPSVSFVSVTGSGWTCDSSNNPTITCTETGDTGGTGGTPVVLQPGQSYPPITVTVQVPLGTGFGDQGSTGGLHVTNAVSVSGGAPSQPTVSIASPTPIVGVPGLTADNAMDGAFAQDGTGRYEITVINAGGAPTNGSSSTPITATITKLPAGVTMRALYGSGWTCDVAATAAEPADTCYRSDVLAGENGEEPPITAVVTIADNAAASGTETVKVGGGGGVGGPASVGAPTTIRQSADLNVASTHSGSFTQGGTGTYTLTVSDVHGPNSAKTGGASYGLVSLSDALPWGLTATAMSGSGWTCDVSAVTCYREDSLAAGSSYPPVTLAVSVAGNAPASATNSVTVSGGGMTYGTGSSTAAGGQTGTDATTITQTGPTGTPPSASPAPALTVTSAHTGSFGQGGNDSAYTLKVSDSAGAGPTTGIVTITDSLPAGLTPTEMSGDGWTCSLAPPALSPRSTSNSIAVPNALPAAPTCYRLDTLAPGSAYPPITLRVAVADNARPSVTNTAAVADGGAPTVSAPDTTAVGQLPALAVSSYPVSGGIIYAPFSSAAADNAYVVTVANDGYGPTSGPVRFSVDLPSGLTPEALRAPYGWSCTLTACTTGSGVSLAAGASAQITVQVAVAPDAPLSAETQLQATGGGEIPAAAIDENNDYSTSDNGGEFTEPTYIALQS
jgi:uncharacterized repeat protein (TIGR01451 family)